MRRTVFVAGVEYQDALDTALWYSAGGDHVYAGITSCDEALADRLKEEYPAMAVVMVDPLKEKEVKAAAELVDSRDGTLDILVLQAGRKCEHDEAVGILHDYDAVLRVLDENINGTQQLIEGFLPLLRTGKEKRIGIITDGSSSIGWTEETGDFAYHMSQAAIHMMEKLYFNQLRPEGFTFRCYAAEPGTCAKEGSRGKGICAGEYISRGFSYDEKEPYIHSEENRLVMKDCYLREIPW